MPPSPPTPLERLLPKSLAWPEGSEVEIKIGIALPEKKAAPLLMSATRPVAAPRTNALLSRRAWTEGTAAQFIDELVARMAPRLPRFHMVAEPAACTFDDGVVGAEVTYRFTQAPLTVLQRHLVRLDAQVLSHFMVTAEASAAAELDELAQTVTAGFRP